jgi:hypothetical protein
MALSQLAPVERPYHPMLMIPTARCAAERFSKDERDDVEDSRQAGVLEDVDTMMQVLETCYKCVQHCIDLIENHVSPVEEELPARLHPKSRYERALSCVTRKLDRKAMSKTSSFNRARPILARIRYSRNQMFALLKAVSYDQQTRVAGDALI